MILCGFLKYPCLPPAGGATNQIIHSTQEGCTQVEFCHRAIWNKFYATPLGSFVELWWNLCFWLRPSRKNVQVYLNQGSFSPTYGWGGQYLWSVTKSPPLLSLAVMTALPKKERCLMIQWRSLWRWIHMLLLHLPHKMWPAVSFPLDFLCCNGLSASLFIALSRRGWNSVFYSLPLRLTWYFPCRCEVIYLWLKAEEGPEPLLPCASFPYAVFVFFKTNWFSSNTYIYITIHYKPSGCFSFLFTRRSENRCACVFVFKIWMLCVAIVQRDEPPLEESHCWYRVA